MSELEFAADFVECRGCDRREEIETARSSESWSHVVMSAVVSQTGEAWCDTCADQYYDEALESAAKKGRIRCYHILRKHPDSHNVRGGRIEECREDGYIPLSDEELRDIRARFHALRETVCPECASPLDEATVTKHGMELPGYECGCGWSGVGKDTSYRRTSEVSDDE